jgi:hypothetical protein
MWKPDEAVEAMHSGKYLAICVSDAFVDTELCKRSSRFTSLSAAVRVDALSRLTCTLSKRGVKQDVIDGLVDGALP